MTSRSKRYVRSVLSGGGAVAVAALVAIAAPAAELKHYDSQSKEFWTKPPGDWFLGDETESQKGLAPVAGPATGLPAEEIEANLKKIHLPQGFKIELYAAGLNSARQMAWGDKGTLFVGAFGVGNVYAVRDQGGKKEVATILKGLKMPTGIAFTGGVLYVADIDRILAFDKPEDALDKMPEGRVVYDDMPPYTPHGWKYLAVDRQGWLYVAFGVPCNICMPPTSTGQIRRVNPQTGMAELVALGVRNSVGGDVDPRPGHFWFTENARDWMGDDRPSDKLNHVAKFGVHFGYPYCHQGDIPDPKYAMGHRCSEFTPPVVKLGNHVAPLGMKFYTGGLFPAEYKNNIFIAEHGSWNRHKYQGGRIVRVIVDQAGKAPREQVFASGWLQGDREYLGRPADIIVAKDGSLLVADDWAGAVYRISYGK